MLTKLIICINSNINYWYFHKWLTSLAVSFGVNI